MKQNTTTMTATQEKKILTYEEALQDYRNGKKLLGKQTMTDNMGIKHKRVIVRHEFHEDNDAYIKFRNVCREVLPYEYVIFEENFLTSTVEIGGGNNTIARQHNRILIETPFAHISINSYMNGLEISRIMVTDQKGKGHGTFLMKLFFNILREAKLDLQTLPIMLECVGAVGGGSNYQQSDLASQTKFFRKFGFRVDAKVSNYSKSYIQMWYKHEKLLVESK